MVTWNQVNTLTHTYGTNIHRLPQNLWLSNCRVHQIKTPHTFILMKMHSLQHTILSGKDLAH